MSWEQLKTLLWLRWRLTRNQWIKLGRVNAFICMAFTVIGLLAALTGGVTGFLLGIFTMADASPLKLMFIFDLFLLPFLFFWMLGVLTEIQRSEAIDLGRLFHLPVTLHGVFVTNYLTSLVTPSIVMMAPLMFGFCGGLALSKGPGMLWLFPLVLGLFFMITAWTYYFRGWLISLMQNQRRRRTVITLATVVFILLCQLPNLYFNVWHRHGGRQKEMTQEVSNALVTTHKVVPVLWAAYGARTLADKNVWPAVWGSLASLAIGSLGLQRAYVATLKFYLGQGTRKTGKSKPKMETVGAVKETWLEKQIPGMPEEASTLALAFFRSMTRAPELKMALVSSLVFLVIFGGSILSGNMRAGGAPKELRVFLASAAVALPFMGFVQPLFNQFGFDRDGFRMLVLLPSRRSHILLGKNMAFVPMAGACTAVLLLLFAVILHVPLLLLLAGILQWMGGFLLLCMLGNFISIMFPYRIGIGSLKPTKMPGTTKLVIFVTHMLFPLAMIPIFIPAVLGVLCQTQGWFPATPVTVMFSALLAGLSIILYRASLKSLGSLLQRREQTVLQVVTREVE